MATADLRRPAVVAVVEAEGVVFVAPMPGGPMQALPGTAAVIWEEATQGGRDGLAQRVAGRTGAVADEIRQYVEDFVEDLITRGVLEGVPDREINGPS